MYLLATDSLQVAEISMGLLGGLALFLYGMHRMADGLKSAAGEGMKRLLAKLTTNRFTAATTGAIVTAVIQSSSVTTVLVVGFVSAGLMSLSQSVGVIMGANVGKTITAQIVAFKVTKYAWLMIALGFAMTKSCGVIPDRNGDCQPHEADIRQRSADCPTRCAEGRASQGRVSPLPAKRT